MLLVNKDRLILIQQHSRKLTNSCTADQACMSYITLGPSVAYDIATRMGTSICRKLQNQAKLSTIGKGNPLTCHVTYFVT